MIRSYLYALNKKYEMLIRGKLEKQEKIGVNQSPSDPTLLSGGRPDRNPIENTLISIRSRLGQNMASFSHLGRTMSTI